MTKTFHPDLGIVLTPIFFKFIPINSWVGKAKKNGELLSLLTQNSFRGIITSDKLMYSDKQLQQYQLHFLLLQSAFDTPTERIPLFELLNIFLTNHYQRIDSAQSSKIIIADGIVDKTLVRGIHPIWLQ